VQDFERRADGVSGRTAGGVANQPAPGHKTLVEDLDATPVAAPESAVDARAVAAQPDQQSGFTQTGTPGAAAPATAPGPLGLAEVAAAIQYHTVQPSKYTKAVIVDIQGKVGVTQSGVMNAATVQGIARRQAETNAERKPNPPLKVDGKAGPRTLPILEPVGLATDASIDTYVADIQGMQGALGKASDQERERLLLAEINDRLDKVHVPIIDKIVPHPQNDKEAVFDPSSWTIGAEPAFLKSKNAAAGLYHEARHAEQAFRVACMFAGREISAGRKPTAAEIASQARIPEPKATFAIDPARALAPGTPEAVEAEGWHDEEPGQAQKGAKNRAALEKFKAAARAYKKARKQDPDADRSDVAAAFQAFKDAQAQSIRDKPNEFDAYFLGDKVDDKLGVSRDKGLELDQAIDRVPDE
jgi:hypothetical protein